MNKFGFALVFTLCAVALVNGQGQQQRYRPRQFARQQAGPAPYAPSGWAPQGARLVLPARQEQYPTTTTDYPATTTDFPEEPPTTVENGYAASGWKPQGERLVLPARQQQYQPPATSYGVPDASYGVPAQVYGPPSQQYGTPALEATDAPSTEPESTEVSDETAGAPTPNPEAEELDLGSGQAPTGRLETEEVTQQQVPEQQQPGAYFVQLADGSLQRIVYVAQPVAAPLQAQVYSQQIQLANPVLVPNYVSYTSPYQSW